MSSTTVAERTTGDALQGELGSARATTDALFSLVADAALYDRPIAERHRLVFYLGHLEAFDRNLLAEPMGLPAGEATLDRLFAFGIDPLDGGLPSDQPSDWPTRAEVVAYGVRARRSLDSALRSRSGPGSVAAPDLHERLQVAIEHRLMHAETLAYLLHELPYEAKAGGPREAPPAATGSVAPALVEVPAGVATLGAREGDRVFGWDNEFEASEQRVPAFSIDRHMVSNLQFVEFVQAGGYGDRSLWSAEGWAWRCREGIDHPRHWERAGSGWGYRGMFAPMAMPWASPVYLSHAEAAAYARWAGKALPTEAQWHRAAFGTPEGRERPFPWGEAPPEARHGNFGFRSWQPFPVDAFPAGRSAFGAEGLLGNGWEWTSSVFAPFPGFAPRAYYPGYSADFFDGRHFVLKGASPRTATRLLRRSFRNWFQPHYPHVYAGFRCVQG